MEYRLLGGSGLKVPAPSIGTATFGGSDGLFGAFGQSGVAEATRLLDFALEHGVTLFDSADIYAAGLSEEILGKAIAGRRDRVLIFTKATFRSGEGPNDVGSSRHHLTRTVEAALRRLGTDYIDLFQHHGFDAQIPLEETLRTLDGLVRSGEIRYLGVSNFSGWHLMKSLAISERQGLERYVAHRAYYSLIGCDYEWELMPLGLDQKVGALVWSPLGWARLTGKFRRGQPVPADTRLQKDQSAIDAAPPSRVSSSARAAKPSSCRTSAPLAGRCPPSRSPASTPPAPRPGPTRISIRRFSRSATPRRSESPAVGRPLRHAPAFPRMSPIG